jgi:thiol-disulfide isomerase/thioredoxin
VLAETGKTPVKTSRISTSGLLIHNKTDRAIEFLGMNAWDGEVPRAYDHALPGLRLALGKEWLGEVIAADQEKVRLLPGAGHEIVEVPWADVVRLRLSHSPAPLKGGGITEMWFHDSGQIKGELLGWKEGFATMRSTASDEVLRVSLDGLTKANLPGMTLGIVQDGSPFEKQDEVASGSSHLHGSLAPGDGAALRWRVPGMGDPATLVNLDDLRIRRADDEVSPVSPLFFLKNGEVLHGTLESMSANQVGVKGGCAPRFQLRGEWMRAIQFSGVASKLAGFSDADWSVLRGDPSSLARSEQSVVLRDGVVLSHPAILQGNQPGFALLPPKTMTVMRVRLFCTGNDANPGNATTLLFRSFGSEIHFGMDDGEGGFQDEWTKAVHDQFEKVPVRIRWEEGWLFVTVNASAALQLRARPRNGVGLRFEIESAGRFRAGDNSVALSDFRVGAVAGQTWMPTVSAEAKTHALTVPRFRKNDPPPQALIATNRDVLRGGIASATAHHVMFRSGLSTFRIPTDRVAAAVWLRPSQEEGEPAFPEAHVGADQKWLLLKNGAQFALDVTRVEDETVCGTHPIMGACRVPLREIQSIVCRAPDITAAMVEFDSWQLQPAPEPVIPEAGSDSPLLGKAAGDLKLPMLDGGELDPARQKGRVVVLDFWATWCGPCIKALPGLITEMSAFSSEEVTFIGVNQGESAETIAAFLRARGWTFPVALDTKQQGGAQFSATGIPHTVIIDTEGRIIWVKTGYSPDAAEEVAGEIRKLLKSR